MAKIVGIDKLFMRRFFGSELNSHNIGNYNQRGCNPEQSSPNLSAIKNFVELFRSHCENLSQTIATSKDTIANTNAFVNLVVSKLTNPGAINMRPIQPADKLPLIPESTLKNDFVTAFKVAEMYNYYNNIVVGRKAN